MNTVDRSFKYRSHTVLVCLEDLCAPSASARRRFGASFAVLTPDGAGTCWQEFSASTFDTEDVAALAALNSAKSSIDDAIERKGRLDEEASEALFGRFREGGRLAP